MTTEARHVLLEGRVQGVAFRWYTRARAVELGLTGWVRNLADGRVEALVEGQEDALEPMIHWLHSGPDAARVDRITVQVREPEGRRSFEVLPTHLP